MTKREETTLVAIKEFANKLPKFPDGRIDYSSSNIAPVITVFLKYKDKILLLKRSTRVRTYQGKWNTVAGYLDEVKPIYEKITEEIQEELGLNENNTSLVHIGKPYKFIDTEINKTWIIHPVLIELKNKPTIELDWEHTEYKWVKPEEIKDFDTVPNIDKSLKNASK